MPRFYFWKDNAVLELDSLDEQTPIHRMCMCVDTAYSVNYRLSRYGLFNNIGSWIFVDPDEFPPEFKMSLLLLGVE